MICRQDTMKVQVLIEKYQSVAVWVTRRDAQGTALYRKTLDKTSPVRASCWTFTIWVTAPSTYWLEVSAKGQTDTRTVTVSTPAPVRLLAVL